MAVVPRTTDGQKSRAIDVDVIGTGDPCADLPPELSMEAHFDQHITSSLILRQRHCEVWRDGHIGAVHVRRPNANVVVSLVLDWQCGGDGDLLALVESVHIELVIVDADAAVGIEGLEGDLEGGGEEGGTCQVEVVDDQVLEIVPRFRRV